MSRCLWFVPPVPVIAACILFLESTVSQPRISALVLGLLLAAAPLAAQSSSSVTGKCGDGTTTMAKSKSGACSNHGGVKEWFGATAPVAAAKPAPKPAPAPAAKVATPPRATPSPRSSSSTAGITGRCADGTTTMAKTKSGACSNHGGVKEWMGTAPAAAPRAAPSPRAAPASRAAPAAAAPVTIPTRAIPGSPAGASALCSDGTYSQSQHRSGSCSSHGGVKQWLKDIPPS